MAAWGSGDFREATSWLREFAEIAEDRHPHFRAEYLPEVIRILAANGDAALIDRLMVTEADVSTAGDQNSVLMAQAVLSEAGEDHAAARSLYQEAAQRWADYGFVLEEGQAHLGLARCLIALGDREAAIEPLQKARAIFSRLGAVPLINETDTYLNQAEAVS